MKLLNGEFDSLPWRVKWSLCVQGACAAINQYDMSALRHINGIWMVGDLTAGKEHDIPGYMKFRLDDRDRVSQYMIAIYYRPSGDAATEVIDSYLSWMSELSTETDLMIARPIANASGRTVTSTRVQLDDSEGLFDSVVLTWLEGEVFHQGETRHKRHHPGKIQPERSPEDLHHLGEVFGQMHQYASKWTVPDDFWTRPPRSTATATDAVQMRHANSNGVSEPYVERIAGLASQIDEYVHNEGIVGLCHGDAGAHNVVVCDGAFGVIDFDHLCFDEYYEELMAAIVDWEPGLRQHIVDGYSSIAGPIDYHKLATHMIRWRLRDGFGVAETPWTDPEVHSEVWEFISKECDLYLHDEQDYLFGMRNG